MTHFEELHTQIQTILAAASLHIGGDYGNVTVENGGERITITQVSNFAVCLEILGCLRQSREPQFRDGTYQVLVGRAEIVIIPATFQNGSPDLSRSHIGSGERSSPHDPYSFILYPEKFLDHASLDHFMIERHWGQELEE